MIICSSLTSGTNENLIIKAVTLLVEPHSNIMHAFHCVHLVFDLLHAVTKDRTIPENFAKFLMLLANLSFPYSLGLERNNDFESRRHVNCSLTRDTFRYLWRVLIECLKGCDCGRPSRVPPGPG